MIAVEIDVSEPSRMFALVEERLLDLSKPFERLGALALADARAAIESQGSPLGPWAPMALLTPIVSRALGGPGRDPSTLLRATGGLMESLVPGGPGNIFEVSAEAASFGSSHPSPRSGFGIASGQQEGTSRTFHVLQGQGFSVPGIPPRPFLGWREDRAAEYEGIFAEYVMEDL